VGKRIFKDGGGLIIFFLDRREGGETGGIGEREC